MHDDSQHHTPLIVKLEYQEGEAVDTVDAPEWFLEYLRGNGVHTHAKLPTEWLHIFATSFKQLEHFTRHLKFGEIQKGLWVSWPKKRQRYPHKPERARSTRHYLAAWLGQHKSMLYRRQLERT